MTILVVGATGATGRLLVKQLLDRQCDVRTMVRSVEDLPAELGEHPRLTIIQASIAQASDTELVEYVTGCDAVASCLGHNLSFRGVFGQPRRLVTDAVCRLCTAVRSAHAAQMTQHGEDLSPAKFVLMNTAGNSNRDLVEPISLGQKIVIGLLRLLLPPHVDNEQAADYLRTEVGQNDDAIQWVAIRPDALIDNDEVTAYEPFPSPTRSAIFNSGKTSRVNVAHFMAELITSDDAWRHWQGQMPVIYNVEETSV